MAIRALRGNILCTDGAFGQQVSKGGIILDSRDGKADGVTPRWFKVHDVGEGIDYLEPGDWVLVNYGRWTEAFEVDEVKYWKVEPESCVGASKEKPESLNYNAEYAVK